MKTYKKRFYRDWISKDGGCLSKVVVKETDLLVRADKDLTKEVEASVYKYRAQIEAYIEQYPDFKTTLIPWKMDRFAPGVVQEMIEASRFAKVGPMAAVAGVIAHFVGCDLLKYSDHIIVENGGDVFIKSSDALRVSIFAGQSPLSNMVGIKIQPQDTPLGICTSSGTVGHSLSFGRADAVTVVSKSTALADAAATSIGNLIQGKEDIGLGLDHAQRVKGILGVIIIVGDRLGSWGKVELTKA